jgi:hypothetical protein
VFEIDHRSDPCHAHCALMSAHMIAIVLFRF